MQTHFKKPKFLNVLIAKTARVSAADRPLGSDVDELWRSITAAIDEACLLSVGHNPPASAKDASRA